MAPFTGKRDTAGAGGIGRERRLGSPAVLRLPKLSACPFQVPVHLPTLFFPCLVMVAGGQIRLPRQWVQFPVPSLNASQILHPLKLCGDGWEGGKGTGLVNCLPVSVILRTPWKVSLSSPLSQRD